MYLRLLFIYCKLKSIRSKARKYTMKILSTFTKIKMFVSEIAFVIDGIDL